MKPDDVNRDSKNSPGFPIDHEIIVPAFIWSNSGPELLKNSRSDFFGRSESPVERSLWTAKPDLLLCDENCVK